MGERGLFDTCIDFEDAGGRFDTTLETHGTIDQASVAAVLHGTYGMKATFDGNGLDLYAAIASGSDVSELYARVYIYVDSNIAGLDANSLYVIGAIYNAAFTVSTLLLVFTDGAGLPVYWYFADTGGLTCYESTTLVAFDTWVMLEIRNKMAIAGVLEGRVNGAA